MAFQKLPSLESEQTIALGGVNKKTGKQNPSTITGFYLGSKEVKSDMSSTGKCLVHIFQTEEGNTGVWGKTNLDRALATAPVGTLLQVNFTGLQKNPLKGRSPAYLFEVLADSEQTISVGALATPNRPEPLDEDSYAEDNFVESDEEDDVDQAPPFRAAAPKQAARTPSAEQQARVQALLSKSAPRK